MNYKLSIEGQDISRFAEKSLPRSIYKDDAMKTKITKFIDLCRQNLSNDLEQELDDEIRFFESTEEAEDKRSLEYRILP